MKDVLFLCHRLPYPPDKGEKIRSYNILRGLSERYRVHLGCFVDSSDDLQHEEVLRDLCGETYFARRQVPEMARSALPAIARGE